MMEYQEQTFSYEEAAHLVEYARDTMEIYIKESQRMDVGSVNDLLNMKLGVFLEIKSTGPYSRIRGSSASFENESLALSIIRSAVRATSRRSIGSEISRTELNDVTIRIAPITSITITDDPVETIDLGTDIPVLISGDGQEWIYPTDPVEYNWSTEEYLRRTCKKYNKAPDYWENKQLVIARTQPITEEDPAGSVKIEHS